jgi:hypothetical protein
MITCHDLCILHYIDSFFINIKECEYQCNKIVLNSFDNGYNKAITDNNDINNNQNIYRLVTEIIIKVLIFIIISNFLYKLIIYYKKNIIYYNKSSRYIKKKCLICFDKTDNVCHAIYCNHAFYLCQNCSRYNKCLICNRVTKYKKLFIYNKE